LLERTDDDLTDAELFAREATDEYWFVSMCIKQLHRLPSEITPILMEREYLTLAAHNVIERAIADMQQTTAGSTGMDLSKYGA
jgi:hypothetical protein